jgi:hypothetical protein
MRVMNWHRAVLAAITARRAKRQRNWFQRLLDRIASDVG